MTRRAIEANLDALRAKLPSRAWMPYVLLGGALVAGVVLSRVPVLRILNTGARVVQTSVAVAGAVAAAQHFFSTARPPRAAPPSNGSALR
jgi:hypothetical protein